MRSGLARSGVGPPGADELFARRRLGLRICRRCGLDVRLRRIGARRLRLPEHRLSAAGTVGAAGFGSGGAVAMGAEGDGGSGAGAVEAAIAGSMGFGSAGRSRPAPVRAAAWTASGTDVAAGAATSAGGVPSGADTRRFVSSDGAATISTSLRWRD